MQSKSVDWFLYDRDLHHERVKCVTGVLGKLCNVINVNLCWICWILSFTKSTFIKYVKDTPQEWSEESSGIVVDLLPDIT